VNVPGMDEARYAAALKSLQRAKRVPVRKRLRARREVEASPAIRSGRLRLCAYGLCTNPAQAGGLCQMHYMQGVRLIQKFAGNVSTGER